MSKSKKVVVTHTVENWFSKQQWKIFTFQRAVWLAALRGQSGLLHATTGSGKTYAVWLAALQRLLQEKTTNGRVSSGLRILWLTPMRALAADTLRALEEPLTDLMPDLRIGMRTGDTSSAERARQTRLLPGALITTPESLCLLLSRANAKDQFKALDMVIVDEWHELIGNKRGVQTQLALSRLRHWQPQLVVWGLSATLGDLRQAQDALLGPENKGLLIESTSRKKLLVDTLIPQNPSRFPWAGHLGMQMLQPVIDEIASHATTLVFTNTRSQAELWYQNLLDARPDWAGLIALHHGSLDKTVRQWVETGLKNGTLKAVVSTSSLDLGVDFLPVERVLQIGSPKGVARLLQRAGRSGHAPGRVSRVTLVPTNSMELLEAAGAKRALAQRTIEPRYSPNKPMDVLVQHLVTVALGGGFKADELFLEVRNTYAYRELTREEWQWALDFVTRGGQSLIAYPEYRRVLADDEGVYRVPDAALGRRHRLNIGTIVSNAVMQVKFIKGGRIGTLEENFVSRLRKGDHFLFGGRFLEFVRAHEMTAYVKRATGNKGTVPRWQGSKMPLSCELAYAMLECLQEFSENRFIGPEMQALKPLLTLQQQWSVLPTGKHLVVEVIQSREGQHLLVYPLAGQLVHLGLASVIAYRIARLQASTFSISVNDYGFELLSPETLDMANLLETSSGAREALFSSHNLLEDTLAGLNASELAQRRFREIARIAGLVFAGYPGQPKTNRQLQASSSLFFEVFSKYDSTNLLLEQAQREVLEQELQIDRLCASLQDMQTRKFVLVRPQRATPFAFPLMVNRLREKLSTEKLSERVARMVRQLENATQPKHRSQKD